MKQAVKVFIVVFLIMYVLTSFVAFTLDCREWDILARYFVVYLPTLCAGLVYLKNRQNER